MIIRNINTKLVYSSLFILIWTFCINPEQIKAQNQIPQNPNQLLANLLSQIEQQMVKHNQDILTNNLTHTNGDFENIKKNLKILIDVFMPLTERLKALQKQEKTILNKTKNLEDQYIPLTPKEQETQNQTIIQEQLETRNDTQKTRDIIAQQKNNITANNDSQPKPQPKTVDTINQLSDYIHQALKNENQAINHLLNSQLKQAISAEKKALDQIEKALKLISPQQPENNQKQNQDQQTKNNQKQNQDQQTKNNQKNQQQPSEKKADQQLSAEEALKLLAQLQKKAEDERKKREKEYGVTLSPQQLPVEKDW
ncbi:MAG: hypothetical protein HOD92_23325 [Deltaproteobacteria bacterium]|jgi:hypothetical protein|nr:hypothetical protein [Deltaproteobacteria bacterium]MBT4524973.1 hypothetical protein [Deltaproteobacteria bacterium]